MAKAKTSKENTTAKSTKEKAVSVSIKSGKGRIYTKKLGAKIAVSARPISARKYHVIIGDGEKWTVVADGNVRATRVFDSKNGAVEFARVTADKIKGEVIIHKKTGEIEDRVSLAE